MDHNRAAAEVTIKAARLQEAVASGNPREIMDWADRVAYALGDVIENATGRKFAGLDLSKAVRLVANSAEDAELEVRE